MTSTRATLLTLAPSILLGLGNATAAPAEPRIVHDAGEGALVISGKSRGRTYRLVIGTEILPKRTQRLERPSGTPIGCDCTWEDHENDLIVIRDFRLTSGVATRTVPHQLTDRIVSPHLTGIAAAVSTNGRNLFVCSYLGDGAGAALAIWSLSLSDERDWLRAGDLISDWSYAELSSSDSCRQRSLNPHGSSEEQSAGQT